MLENPIVLAAFTCFLYCHAIDMDKGFKQESKMPVECRNEITEITDSAKEAGKRKMKEPGAVAAPPAES